MSNQPRTVLLSSGGNTATPSATTTQTILQTSEPGPSIPIPSLRLRAQPEEQGRRHIQWAEDVIDNEGMGKKSSKVCCIYHKPREPGDSDSDSDSSSSSDSDDEEPDLSRAQRAGGGGSGKGRGGTHDHGCEDGGGDSCGKGKRTARKASPNAYERQPKSKSTKDG